MFPMPHQPTTAHYERIVCSDACESSGPLRGVCLRVVMRRVLDPVFAKEFL